MYTRSGRLRTSLIDSSPPRTRKGVSPPRTPGRRRKSSPTASAPASPSRKSPARKSPSRKPVSKFPARKSPSRTNKESIEATQKSLVKPSPIKQLEIKLDNVSSKIESVRSTRFRRTEYSIKDIAPEKEKNELFLSENQINGVHTLFASTELRNRKSEDTVLRRSSRLRDAVDSVPNIRNSVSKSISQSISKSISLDKFSEHEDSEEEFRKEKSRSVNRKLATPLRESVGKLARKYSRWEFGGRIGTSLLILLVPLTVFVLLISCNKSCSIQTLWNPTSYRSISVWFSRQALILICSQWIIQALFTVLPICGIRASKLDDTDQKYCFNAFFSSNLMIGLLIILYYFDLFKIDTIQKDYLKLASVSYIFGCILSVVLYIKGGKENDEKLNIYGNTGYAMYDFWMGREIHPHFKRLNVKIWISRISNINTLILAIVIFKNGYEFPQETIHNYSFENLKHFLSKVQLKPTILLYSSMQILYILYFITREYKITSTFYWQSEGVGYLQIIASALYPFYFTTISKFVADNDLVLSTNILISASILYALGFFIMLLSNNIKYEFRKNSLQPGLANVDSMPTFLGKKLIVSGLWGTLRHPNYLGDIMMHTSMALPGILTANMLAAGPALLTIVVLLHRAWRDHARCGRRYGAAWQRYCKRVPSTIIPKVL